MDYRNAIRTQLHSSLVGLKQDDGLEWLNNSLNLLDKAGMNLTVKSFLSDMGNYSKANGFLLEVEIALAAINAFPSSTVRSEQLDGAATKPGDISIIDSAFRVDIQCKNILNIHSELFLEEFLAWVEVTFAHILPGRLIEIQPNTKASAKTFQELRIWFNSQLNQMDLEQEYLFEDSEQSGKVWITLLEANGPGIREGIIYGASDDPFFAQDEDNTRIQQRLLNRLKEAKPTFGFSPGPQQFNLVAVQFPSLNALADEESIVTALYGSEKAVLLADGTAIMQTQPDGLFHTHSSLLTICSGMIYSGGRSIGVPECVLFPNYGHVDHLNQSLNGHGTFRLTNKISLAGVS